MPNKLHAFLTALALYVFPLAAQERDYERLLEMKSRRKVILKASAEKTTAGHNRLTGDQIRNAPATFGDSLNALTTLPGIARTNTLFGSLIIRGMGSTAQRYFVDGIPIQAPQHFGGLHSVIHNDLISELNLYASAFPARYGGATGSVIEFITVDEAEKFGGVVDIGLVSANFLLRSPWPGGENRPAGYWTTAARVGYLPLVVPPVYEAVTGTPAIALPQYYDYQLKGKLGLDEQGKHTLALLALGSYDIVSVQRQATSDEASYSSDLKFLRPGTRWEVSGHSQGLYYDYEPSRKFSNRLIFYNALALDRFSYRDSFSPYTDYSTIRPNLAGFKNHLSLTWLEGIATFNAGIEHTVYYYAASSQSSSYTGIGNSYITTRGNASTVHHAPSGFAENRFRFGGLLVTPSVRADYLVGTSAPAIGPRGRISYEFSTGTTLEAAAGVYQAYPQVNPAYANTYAYDYAQLTEQKSLLAEEAVHRSVAVAQKYRQWDIKLEGYGNRIYRQIEYSAGNAPASPFRNAAESESLGAELLLRKSPDGSGSHDFYGWASYTLAHSRSRGDTSEYDQRHVGKLVAGYLHGIHNLSIRFELFTGQAYYPIIGSEPSSTYPGRHFPIHSNTRSAHYPLAHRLSLRYSQERTTVWGSWKWYIEVINATNYAPLGVESFNSTQPYAEGENPTFLPAEPRIPILPSFGVEVRF